MLECIAMQFLRCHTFRWLTGLLIVCAVSITQSDLMAAAPQQSSEELSKPLYNPPKKLAPRARVGGDARGTDDTDPEVILLVPDHVGYTMQQTPAVNWFLSKTTGYQVRFTLRDDRSQRWFKEITIPTPQHPGIHTINLKEFGLVLEPNVQYRLYVSVIRDPQSPSKDIVTGGMIERCELSECVEPMGAKLTCSLDTVNENAKAGFWYDAMGCLCSLIDADPKNEKLRRVRARLLKDVGLNGVADWELRALQASTR
jgi:Domain of Unknown Function (DUF928)